MNRYALAEKVVAEFAAAVDRRREAVEFTDFSTPGIRERILADLGRAVCWRVDERTVVAETLAFTHLAAELLDSAADRAGTPFESGFIATDGGRATLTW